VITDVVSTLKSMVDQLDDEIEEHFLSWTFPSSRRRTNTGWNPSARCCDNASRSTKML
jgi:hypothetical protein